VSLGGTVGGTAAPGVRRGSGPRSSPVSPTSESPAQAGFSFPRVPNAGTKLHLASRILFACTTRVVHLSRTQCCSERKVAFGPRNVPEDELGRVTLAFVGAYPGVDQHAGKTGRRRRSTTLATGSPRALVGNPWSISRVI
jgi:hypothetical protein